MATPSTRRPARARGDVAQVCDGTALGRKRLRQVGVAALSSQLKHIRDSVAVVSEQSGVEDIHQMRVATRRLRTMAHLLQQTPPFRAKRVARLRERLQPLAQYLGAVRDLDILLESLDAYERSVVEPTQTSSALRDELLWRREKALHHLRRALSQPATQRLLRRPKRTAKRMLSRSRSARRVLVRHVAGDALWRRYEAVLSFEEVVNGFAATEELHALRITCKQLRYALELFSEDDDACAESLIETLKAVQDHLGELQDSVFAVTLLTHLRHDYPRNHLLEGFRADQETRRNALRQDFMPLWETISGSKYRQDLAGLIAAL